MIKKLMIGAIIIILAIITSLLLYNVINDFLPYQTIYTNNNTTITTDYYTQALANLRNQGVTFNQLSTYYIKPSSEQGIDYIISRDNQSENQISVFPGAINNALPINTSCPPELESIQEKINNTLTLDCYNHTNLTIKINNLTYATFQPCQPITNALFGPADFTTCIYSQNQAINTYTITLKGDNIYVFNNYQSLNTEAQEILTWYYTMPGLR